jgi:hypothetical protein
MHIMQGTYVTDLAMSQFFALWALVATWPGHGKTCINM